jgi:hypothetical protein
MAKVSFGDDAIPGYECGDKTLPGVIVLQEWWGVTENIKKQALYISSKVTSSPELPTDLIISQGFLAAASHTYTTLPSQEHPPDCLHSTRLVSVSVRPGVAYMPQTLICNP